MRPRRETERLRQRPFGGPAGLADHPSAYIRINWGNSRNFLQCDNAFAGGNGKVYSIRIPNALHP
jgi:hypothetical protein